MLHYAIFLFWQLNYHPTYSFIFQFFSFLRLWSKKFPYGKFNFFYFISPFFCHNFCFISYSIFTLNYVFICFHLNLIIHLFNLFLFLEHVVCSHPGKYPYVQVQDPLMEQWYPSKSPQVSGREREIERGRQKERKKEWLRVWERVKQRIGMLDS